MNNCQVLIGVLSWLCILPGGHGTSPCDHIIASWLGNLSLLENPENATLTVQWGDLGFDLLEKGCPVEQLSLELWRVDQHSRRPDDFGTQGYFSAFERCNKLEPEHFLFHSHKVYRHNDTQVTFVHTVEAEYMFRVCPCHRRRHRSVSCDCQHDGVAAEVRPQCSQILAMDPDDDAEVMPWCLSGPAVLPHVGKRVEEVSLKSMLMNCTHLLVAGTMASCTPIQSYDHVLLTFHKLENGSSQTCWEHRDFGTHNPVKVVSRLYSQSPYMESLSHGMGDFTSIVGLSADSSYCVQLEHVGHPYCMREITISHSSTYRMPRVCSVHMAKPISTAICSAPHTNVVTRFNFAQDPIFVATALALVTVVLIAGYCLARKCCFSGRRKFKSGQSRPMSSEHEPMIAKILTVDGVLGSPIPSSNSSQTEVFLLHFLRDDQEEDAELRYSQLQNWMQSLADVVHDIEDEEADEDINQDPEGWVMQRLCVPDVRVVVVASRSVTQQLRCSSLPEVSSPSCSSSGDGSSTASSSGEQNLDPREALRIYALKHIQSHFAGNYRQLTVVCFDRLDFNGESVARLLTPNKGPLVLPHHLSDLQHWIASGHVRPPPPGPSPKSTSYEESTSSSSAVAAV